MFCLSCLRRRYTEGISLNEVYERLDEIDADGAPARAGSILGGLGFDAEMQNQATKVRGCGGGGGGRSKLSNPRRLLKENFATPVFHQSFYVSTYLI